MKDFYETVKESNFPHLKGFSKSPVLLLYNLTRLEIHILAPSDEDEL